MTSRSLPLRAALAASVLLTAPLPALAQGYASLSCADLWYRRNAIYAERGYCFQSARAIQTFGRGCFPPYGRLTRAQQREVAAIQRAESRRRCPA